MPPRSTQKKLTKSSPKPSPKTLEAQNPKKIKTVMETPSKAENPPQEIMLESTADNGGKAVSSNETRVYEKVVEVKNEILMEDKGGKNVEIRVSEEVLGVKNEMLMEEKGEKNETLKSNEEEEYEEYEEYEEEEEIEEVEEPVRERRKQKEYEVFVGGLHQDAVEEDLEKVFKKVGEVVEVRLVRKPHSQKNKGFAFVRFATVEQAERALTELKVTRVRGKVCGVTRRNDNETLHLRNICTSWTQDDLVEKLKAYDLHNLEEVHLMEDPTNKGKNRGYAFLDFGTHSDAVAACTKLQKRDVFLGTDIRAEVAFSNKPDAEVMAQVKSVFLDGLPSNWDEAHVRELFNKYGEIENIELARNMPTAKRKDFGFICFKTRDSALTCIEDVNKVGVVDGTQKVSVKATLRKPLLKRPPPMLMGGWRGYDSKIRGGRWVQPRGTGRSYPSRPSRSREFGRFDGIGRSPYVDDEFETAVPRMGRYGARLERESIRRLPAPAAAHSRSRDPYFESSSSGRHIPRSDRDFSPSYSGRPSRGLYYDDGYDPRFEYYENRSTAAYDYPAPSGSKRSFSTLEEDLPVSYSLTRRAKRGLDLELDAYPQQSVSAYDEYSRILPDDPLDYDRRGYPSRSYGRGYLSRSGASRSFY
ncbi:uncharacterized protein LOC143886548 isoform X2 [Tasmannia lanceolata]|uniref:uncharacterized protein LOC143886548 isoform X2 n=1 Tax=Tasmannia lanceolata TaxID=3420 RepID=UPI004063E88B